MISKHIYVKLLTCIALNNWVNKPIIWVLVNPENFIYLHKIVNEVWGALISFHSKKMQKIAGGNQISGFVYINVLLVQ